MLANPEAIKYLLLVTPSMEKAQELLESGLKREIKSEYWQGVYDFFRHMNDYMNSEEL